MSSDDVLQIWNGPQDYDLDAHVTNVRTGSIVQAGGLLQQTQEYVHQTRSEHFLRSITNNPSNTGAGNGDIVRHQVRGVVINYFSIQPTVRGNAVYVSLNGIEFINIGGIFYPMAGFVAQPNQPTVNYRIPPQRDFRFELWVQPPAGYVAGYEDRIVLAYGYLPDGNDRVAKE